MQEVVAGKGCSVIPVEQTLSRGQAAFPAPVCYFSLGPEGREMPGPLLIQETEEGKCEWLLSEAICREETPPEASQLSRERPRTPSPAQAW